MVETFTGTSFYMAVMFLFRCHCCPQLTEILQPERVSGHPYSIRADVWSTGLSLVELAHNKFPLPEDLDGIIALIDYITKSPVCISRWAHCFCWLIGHTLQPIELQDDDEVTWSDSMKDFIRQWFVLPSRFPFTFHLLSK
jgi:mitogen-activated protein kinase kinase